MLNVIFHCDQGMITKIDLEASQGKTDWKIISNKKDAVLEKMIDSWMEDYAKCKQPKVQLPLDLDALPAYTKRILAALREIPFGKTATYQELAIKTKNPRAARAVGNACGRNPFPLIIPCHRIIKSDGGLGGFAFGTTLKKALLAYEQI